MILKYKWTIFAIFNIYQINIVFSSNTIREGNFWCQSFQILLQEFLISNFNAYLYYRSLSIRTNFYQYWSTNCTVYSSHGTIKLSYHITVFFKLLHLNQWLPSLITNLDFVYRWFGRLLSEFSIILWIQALYSTI